MNTPPDPPSPYQSPTADLSEPIAPLQELPPHQRSAAPKVFGVLSIIFSSLVLLGSSFSLLGTLASSASGGMGNMVNDGDKAAEINAMVAPMARIFQGLALESLILFLMSALLLAIGIGQLRYRAWARRWSVYWAVAGLACVVLLVVISMLIVSPAYADLLDGLSRIKPPNGEAPMPQLGSLSGLVGGVFAITAVILYTPYPALMLLFFTREHVRASMTR
jgi:hypothetical protein